MNNSMKITVTLLAAVASIAMIGTGLYGFLHELKNWGPLLLAGMACGFTTMCAAYNA
jgi:uncharacterized membrane protein